MKGKVKCEDSIMMTMGEIDRYMRVGVLAKRMEERQYIFSIHTIRQSLGRLRKRGYVVLWKNKYWGVAFKEEWGEL
jgi:repressor of nif and glnA expression